MAHEQPNKSGGEAGGGENGINSDKRSLTQVILDLSAFGQRISAFAERLLEITGDGRGSEFLAAAAELDQKFIPAAHNIVSDLRLRAMRGRAP